MAFVEQSILTTIAKELSIRELQVKAAVKLLDQGASVPFIAHYRAASTAGLQDAQLRMLVVRLSELRTLSERRAAILTLIAAQESPVPGLIDAVNLADTRGRLEALNAPLQKKRRSTRTAQAHDAGLDALAKSLLENNSQTPDEQAEKFLNPNAGVVTTAQALDGAQQLLIEHFSENQLLINTLRRYVWAQGVVHAGAAKNQLTGKKKKYHTAKYAAYLNYEQPICRIAPDKARALFLGREDQILQLKLSLPASKSDLDLRIATFFNILQTHPTGSPTLLWLMQTIQQAITTMLWTKLETDALAQLREHADAHTINLLSNELREVLLVAPVTPGVTLGLEPAGRAGLNAAVVDTNGQHVDAATIFPFAAQQEWHPALITLAKLVVKHNVQYISIGDAQGVRDTERLVQDMLRMYPDFSVTVKRVSNVGTWASRVCAESENTWRGAVSIARRMQDPLAELVTIEPRALTIGQVQHARQPVRLVHFLTGVVEECVCRLGVNLNTATCELLACVPGLNSTLAVAIVQHRATHGPFVERSQLLNVAGVDAHIFQQAAGFLKLTPAHNPLDAYKIHPEAYALVEVLLQEYNGDLPALFSGINTHQPENYVNPHMSLELVRDIFYALEAAPQDPRQLYVFKKPAIKSEPRREPVNKVLKPRVNAPKTMPFNTSMADAFAKLKREVS